MGGCLATQASSMTPDPSRKNMSLNHKSYNNSKHGQPSLPDFGVAGHFTTLQLLGEGGSGVTYLCQEKVTGRRVAIKFMNRPLAKVVVPLVVQEFQLQTQLAEGHLNLVRVEGAILSPSHLGLIMEYVPGGTLTAYVSRRARLARDNGGLFLDEDEARYFFKQFISAVEYLHRCHVAHRDLKMDNVVLLDTCTPGGAYAPPTIKLCDFGFAKQWGSCSGAAMLTRIGTPVYMSPQLVSSTKDGQVLAYNATASDVWACGVLLFVALLGLFPYDHPDHPDPNSSGAHTELWLQHTKGRWREAPHVQRMVPRLSPELCDLLDRIFELEEAKRISVPAMKEHPWFQKPLPPSLEEALADLACRQDRLEQELGGPVRGKLKARDDAIARLVETAGRAYDSSLDQYPVVRVDLGSAAFRKPHEAIPQVQRISIKRNSIKDIQRSSLKEGSIKEEDDQEGQGAAEGASPRSVRHEQIMVGSLESMQEEAGSEGSDRQQGQGPGPARPSYPISSDAASPSASNSNSFLRQLLGPEGASPHAGAGAGASDAAAAAAPPAAEQAAEQAVPAGAPPGAAGEPKGIRLVAPVGVQLPPPYIEQLQYIQQLSTVVESPNAGRGCSASASAGHYALYRASPAGPGSSGGGAIASCALAAAAAAPVPSMESVL